MLVVLTCGLIALVAACGPDDGSQSPAPDAGPDAGTDGDTDVDTGSDAGSDAGDDAGEDGGADTDVDSDADTDPAPPPCDPMICDDGCYKAGKDYGQCVGDLCECFGDRDMGNCGCRAAGATTLERGLLGVLLSGALL
jgi:hypothetical protein